MNPTVAIILEIVPLIVALTDDGVSQNTIITKLVRFAERQITGSGKGSDRLSLVLAIIRKVHPTMLETANQLEAVERKIALSVVYLKNIDDNDVGFDDMLADKLAGALSWVDELGDWFRRNAENVPTFIDEGE